MIRKKIYIVGKFCVEQNFFPGVTAQFFSFSALKLPYAIMTRVLHEWMPNASDKSLKPVTKHCLTHEAETYYFAEFYCWFQEQCAGQTI